MDSKKQKLIIEYLISSTDVFALCTSIIKPAYFDPEFRNAVSFIKDYYTKFSATPDAKQIEAETGTVVQKQPLKRDQIEYCSTEVEAFCRRKAMEQAILTSASLLDKGEEGKIEEIIKDALTISLHRNLGLEYFEDPEARIKETLNSKVQTPTGWRDLDRYLHGGINRKQMLLFSANSGVGKSVVMANLGLNLLEQGLNVLYLSLELTEEMVAQRLDSMITGVHTAEWKQRSKEIPLRLDLKKGTMGKLFIKKMTIGVTTANMIRSYLKEFELQHEMVPDVLIVDYIDIMASNDKTSGDNIYQKDKAVSQQLYSLAEEYNMFLITASQQNRGAVDQQHLNHSHIAGGISKIDITDNYISIIGTDKMKAAGEIAFQLLKTRSSDGVGKYVNLKWDAKTLRVTDQNASQSSSITTISNNNGPKSLEELIAINTQQPQK